MADKTETDFRPGWIEAVAQFKAAWRAGRPPDVREFAAQHDDGSGRLFQELVVVDYLHRRRARQLLPVEAYLEQYAQDHPELKKSAKVVVALAAIEKFTTRSKADLLENYLKRFEAFAPAIRRLFGADGSAAARGFRVWTEIINAAGLKEPALSEPEPVADERQPAAGPIGPNATVRLQDEFRVVRLLKTAGQKEVFEAVQRSCQRAVALKSMRSSTAAQRLFDEGRIQAMLDHQSIPPIYILGPDPDAPTYLAEKLIDGQEWKPRLPFAEDDLRILLKVSRALARAHEKQVIHRDVKPANVMLRSDEVFLIDWGLALYLGEQPDPAHPLPGRDQARGGVPGLEPVCGAGDAARALPRALATIGRLPAWGRALPDPDGRASISRGSGPRDVFALEPTRPPPGPRPDRRAPG